MASDDLLQSVRAYLSSKQLCPPQQWLASFTASARPNSAPAALKKSAEFKLLASDITQSLDKDTCNALPGNAVQATVKEQQILHPVIVQILDIEDISRSRWSQIELLEQQERGEMTRGREIIRLNPDSDDGTTVNMNPDQSKGPHKLLVQDVNGTKIYAFELTPISGISLATGMGAKLLIRSATIARGMILLEAGQVELLGGKVNAWAEQWTKDRKDNLKSRLPDDSNSDQ
ncbi:RecQ mediated genome instability protein-like protein Rmi1 [Elsinoe ampelina]|uniref:RecQ-mediated genome instability protein 1 n=1 Tax=Elsinoe ampelina TaxID=302913 RepID=A0A6A6G2C1_9PEZI|nr:RecQ mediated genome instability protein-like protein Rmi1 [Elsinoe ampelina]